MLTWRSLGLLVVSVCALDASCTTRLQEPSVGDVEVKSASLVRLDCQDSIDMVYRNPGELHSLDRGDVLRCAKGETLSADALRDSLAEGAFVDIEVHNDVQVYRISYRTLRATHNADVSSALVVLPLQDGDEAKGDGDYDQGDHQGHGGDDRNHRSVYNDDQLAAVIVYGHGTVPFRQDCGYSRASPATATFLGAPDRELRTVLALAAQGYPVIMPDYAGFVEGSPAAGYMFAEDEAYSVLDATRAMKNLLEKFSDKVVLVGHSQGGHAVLSAHAYARSYGLAGNLAGVVTLAPFWAPARSFGIISSPDSGYTSGTPDGTFALDAAVEYFFTHGELLDGVGQGDDVLRFDIRDLIGTKGTECLELPDISTFGETGGDIFKESFAPVSSCALGGEGCDEEAAQKWSERFIRDRPALDADGAPVLVWHGKLDAVVPTNIAGCGIETLSAQLPDRLKVCADADADHESVESNNAKYVIQWINARTQNGPEPTAACGDPDLLEASCFVGNFD
jgi:pimeloyl-ACP methyl ester carboxylesterase